MVSNDQLTINWFRLQRPDVTLSSLKWNLFFTPNRRFRRKWTIIDAMSVKNTWEIIHPGHRRRYV